MATWLLESLPRENNPQSRDRSVYSPGSRRLSSGQYWHVECRVPRAAFALDGWAPHFRVAPRALGPRRGGFAPGLARERLGPTKVRRRHRLRLVVVPTARADPCRRPDR